MKFTLCKQKSYHSIVATLKQSASQSHGGYDFCTLSKLNLLNSCFRKAIIYHTVLVNPLIDAECAPPPKRRRVHKRHIDHHPILRPLLP